MKKKKKKKKDLSMVSDASSGPPHLNEEERYGGNVDANGNINGCFYHYPFTPQYCPETGTKTEIIDVGNITPLCLTTLLALPFTISPILVSPEQEACSPRWRMCWNIHKATPPPSLRSTITKSSPSNHNCSKTSGSKIKGGNDAMKRRRH
ncbi:UNVERIFIED_CONTAM: hypothetical protein Sangu_0628600 [Sesamum angustifolium]|uniref:Uncharacterized protein n=1 Tax=Sesamum angustifolium TaxID=2727405 RepID=A0AAW2QC63_9LAMI